VRPHDPDIALQEAVRNTVLGGSQFAAQCRRPDQLRHGDALGAMDEADIDVDEGIERRPPLPALAQAELVQREAEVMLVGNDGVADQQLRCAWILAIEPQRRQLWHFARAQQLAEGGQPFECIHRYSFVPAAWSANQGGLDRRFDRRPVS
jgi:hypothetical protein